MTQKEKQTFSWKARAQSFVYAWDGFKALMRTEHNAYIHLVAAVMVLIAGFVLNISRMEFMILVIVISMVIVAEIFNTALEKAMDFISLEIHPQIKLVKDLASAAVSLAALAAIIVGGIIFIPKLLHFFN